VGSDALARSTMSAKMLSTSRADKAILLQYFSPHRRVTIEREYVPEGPPFVKGIRRRRYGVRPASEGRSTTR